ncbi:hypothetical protein TNCV_3684041 [Trichonephila clavipes]|nr:hypothetical protein TNCV_3684041 [Trichonephila clavipes]
MYYHFHVRFYNQVKKNESKKNESFIVTVTHALCFLQTSFDVISNGLCVAFLSMGHTPTYFRSYNPTSRIGRWSSKVGEWSWSRTRCRCVVISNFGLVVAQSPFEGVVWKFGE